MNTLQNKKSLDDYSEWIINFGFGIALVSYAIRFFSDPLKEFWFESFEWCLIGYTEIIGLGIGISAAIIFGARKLRLPESTFKQAGQFISGILIGVIFIGMNLSLSFILPSLLQDLLISDEQLAKMEARLDKEDIKPEIIERFKEIIAHEKYIKTGFISSYVSNDGNVIKHDPSESDILVRESIKRIENSSPHFKRWAYIWSGVIIISVIVGFTTRVKSS